jgi:hypothetical protein
MNLKKAACEGLGSAGGICRKGCEFSFFQNKNEQHNQVYSIIKEHDIECCAI